MILSNDTLNILDSLAAMGYFVEVIDNKGYYIYCSDNIDYETGNAQDLVGQYILDAFNLTEETSVLLETIRTGKPQRDIFLRYKTKSTGMDLYWLYNSFPIVINGNIEGAIAVYKTVEAIKNTMQEYEAINKDSKKLGNIMPKKKGLFSFEDIICRNDKMLTAIELSKKISKRDSSVLLTGETGTGKELFAQSIHNYGPKRDKPFVAVNCAAIPENLLESILFGTSKGAYTGAVEKQGLFEESSEGTIYLDELQALNPDMQAKLLRVLETKMIRRVGSTKEIPINTRVISSMNINPLEYIAAGKMKADLFYRLAVITIDIPPLRNRKDDIPLLMKNFIDSANQSLGMNIISCTDEVFEIFDRYSWPGNVRELKHVIEYAANMMNEDARYISSTNLPPRFSLSEDCKCCNTNPVIQRKQYPIGDYKIIHQQALDEFNDSFNKEYLKMALDKFNGNISQTAHAINISRQHLHELINKYEIK